MKSQRITAWLIASRFGVPSEVWMYRHARGMNQLSLRVQCHDYERPDIYPPDGFEVNQLPMPEKARRKGLSKQAYLQLWALQNRKLGGFRGPPELAAEWDRQLQADRPQVALCHYGTMAVQMAPLLLNRRVPIVAHFNGFDLSSAIRRPVYKRLLCKYAPRFAACVVVADYMAEWLQSHGVPLDRIHKIPYGVPIAEIPTARNVGCQPCSFLMVGRLTPKKRPDLSIRAFAECLKVAPEARLTIIGDGELADECRQLARELEVEQQIKWLGSQSFDVVKQNLADASVFVQHSVTASSGDKEGWPVAIAEAAGSGLPVISTRHASIPEQVDHGVTGLLCDEGDWRTMGEHMAQLAKDPDRRVQMGTAARRKLEMFDSDKQIAKLQDLLLAVARK